MIFENSLKLHEPECKLKEFSNIASIVNPKLLELSYDYSFINVTAKIANASALLFVAAQIQINDKLARSQSIIIIIIK